jgi:hypothetical protein
MFLMRRGRMTDGEIRKLGAYHTGIETKVVGVRMPVDKIEAVRAVFEKAGMTMSEGMEWVVDTQILRKR